MRITRRNVLLGIGAIAAAPLARAVAPEGKVARWMR
jgi:hypothetical protein